MSKKAARRKTTKKPPPVSAKPLRGLGAALLNRLPSNASRDGELFGLPLPPDLESATRYYASREFAWIEQYVTTPPWEWCAEDEETAEDYPDYKPANLGPGDWIQIRKSLEDCFRQGFYLALLRYGEDLENVPEAAALLEANRRGAKKGGEARRAAAAPRHKAICKRFRELRKTVPKATALYLRIAKEFGMDEGSVGRIVRRYLS